MEWTKERPTVPGWYWQKRVWPTWDSGPNEIVYLRIYRGKLCQQNWEPDWDNYAWAGPIPEPENP
uniref:Uncharacterized protein n=1 Tax=viral metagenome TaxID=1070528 RepID=A0A6M3LFR8_9ZZZZ